MVAGYAKITLGHSRHRSLNAKLQIFKTLVLLTYKAKYHAESEVEQNIFGFKVTANSPQTLLALFIEIFIHEVYYFKSEQAKPKIIDCGANMGISVLYFKHLYPRAQIIAIEPNPIALHYLRKNIRQNSFQDILVEEVCVSDKIGKENFFYSSKLNIVNASIFPDMGIEFLQEVNGVLLSDYLSKDMYDLVKIDIEGAERQVFEELKFSGQLTKSKQYIIEYHNSTEYLKDILEEMLDVFSDAGFTCDFNKNEIDKVLRFGLLIPREP